MKRTLSFVFTVSILILFSGVSAEACWCRNDPEETNTPEKFKSAIARAVDSADFVFAGTPIEETDTHLTFTVANVWKGGFRDRITFYRQQDFINSCQLNFEVGKTYLVYANVAIGGLAVNKCGRTNFIEKSAGDVDELDRQFLPVSRLFSETAVLSR